MGSGNCRSVRKTVWLSPVDDSQWPSFVNGKAWVVLVLHSVLMRSAPTAGTRKTAFLDRMLPAKAKHERDLQVVAS